MKMTKKRPVSVTVISLLLLLPGIFVFMVSLYYFLKYLLTVTADISEMMSDPTLLGFIPHMMITLGLSSLFPVITGFGLFKGFRWGRLLFFALIPFQLLLTSFLSGLPTFGWSDLLFLVFYVVAAYFLLREDAKHYFS